MDIPHGVSALKAHALLQVRDVSVNITDAVMMCEGLPEAEVTGMIVDRFTAVGARDQKCKYCHGLQYSVSPELCLLNLTL